MRLFGNILKNNALDSGPILCPLTDSFELEFRTDVVTCEIRSSEFRNLEVFEYSDEVRRFAPLPRTVYLVVRVGIVVHLHGVCVILPPAEELHDIVHVLEY